MQEHGSPVPYSERLQVLKETILAEMAEIHKKLGVRQLMERIRDNIWKEGELFWASYYDYKLDGDFTPREFEELPIGFSLQAEIPIIVATYRRPAMGQEWSKGVECHPGVIRGQGYYTLYGDYEFAQARIETGFIDMMVFARPKWEEGRFPAISYEHKPPIGYELVVSDFRLPTGEAPIKSGGDLATRGYSESETYHDLGSRHWIGPRDRETIIGIGHGETFVIDAQDEDAGQQLQWVLKEIVESRKNRKGLPSQMRDEGSRLIEAMPTEFQIKGTATKEELLAWSPQRKSSLLRLVSAS